MLNMSYWASTQMKKKQDKTWIIKKSQPKIAKIPITSILVYFSQIKLLAQRNLLLGLLSSYSLIHNKNKLKKTKMNCPKWIYNKNNYRMLPTVKI